MAAESADGRPPRRGVRRREWAWLIGGLVLLVSAAIVYAALSGAQLITVGMAIVLITLLFLAAVPAWGAGLLRGGEHRRVRRRAERRGGR